MRLVRILIGYLIACFGAALTIAAFAYAPNTIDAAIDGAPEILDKAWAVSPYATVAVALLAAIPALLAIQYAESHKVRSLAYYALVAAVVAVGAYWLAHGTETVPVKSDGNTYASIAFAAAGLVFGLLYWLFSGRYAHPTTLGRPGSLAIVPGGDTHKAAAKG